MIFDMFCKACKLVFWICMFVGFVALTICTGLVFSGFLLY